jgi:hypothetical protein
MPKKIKPAKKRDSAKLVEGARDFVLDAYDTAASLLTKKEKFALIASLGVDLATYRSEIEYADACRPARQKPGELRIRNQGDRTIITLVGIHKGAS